MSSLLIKNMPEELHKKLKEQAKKHRRSMTQEAITILEQELLTLSPEIPPPVQGTRNLPQDMLTGAIKDGRE
jgi:plasmid stability protein